MPFYEYKVTVHEKGTGVIFESGITKADTVFDATQNISEYYGYGNIADINICTFDPDCEVYPFGDSNSMFNWSGMTELEQNERNSIYEAVEMEARKE